MAALIELNFGRRERARDLCQSQLNWIAERSTKDSLPQYVAIAFQPWVNLARLARIEGNIDKADLGLQVLMAAFRRQSVTLGNLTVIPGDWPKIFEATPTLERFLPAVWSCEQLLIALRHRRFDLLDRVDLVLNGIDLPGAKLAIIEARLIADCLPDGPRAQEADSLELPSSISELQLHAIALRRFAVKAHRGSLAPSDQSQVKGIARLHLAAEKEVWRLAVIQHSLALLVEWQAEGILEIAEAGYAAGSGIGDEVFSAWFAQTGHEISGGAVEWKTRLETLRAVSWYEAVRGRERPNGPSPIAALDSLTVRLQGLARQTAS